MYWLFYEV